MCRFGGIFVVTLLVIFGLSSCGTPTKSMDEQIREDVESVLGTPTPTTQLLFTPTPQRTIFSDGDNAILRTSAGGAVFLATTKGNYDELVKLVNAGDQLGIIQLMANGRLYEVQPFTKVLVIDHTGLFDSGKRVRILSGDYIGRDGWIAEEFLH